MKEPNDKHEIYYVPEQSKWPIIATIGISTLAVGAALTFHGKVFGPYILIAGAMIIIAMMYGWFSNIISENKQGLYSAQMHRTFRWGMFWFIFSEVWFFIGFFGTLFYVRNVAIPFIAGAGRPLNKLLWPHFEQAWPLLINPNQAIQGPLEGLGPLWLPTINTFILILSSVTLTISHHALIAGRKKMANQWLIPTIILGVIFLFLQAHEYMHAYAMGLKLSSGIYGSTFYMLTGFHGFHVTIGTIMLMIMCWRNFKDHFSSTNHFAFEAAVWYWHFVDVVWLLLFIYVYILPLK
jgi:cytochrome c oxidase subunit 3